MSEYWRLRPNQEQLERLQKAIKKYGTQGEIQLPKEDKYEVDGSKYWSDKATEKIKELEEENEQLKKDYQQLHQIESRLRVRIKELEQKRRGV